MASYALPRVFLLSAPKPLSAAWALLGAGCGRVSNPGAAPKGPAPAPKSAAPPPVKIPPEFAGLSDPVALRFYQKRGWRPAWNPGQSDALTLGLKEARRHGLEHVSFAPRTTPGGASVRQDIGLTLTALRYAQALSSGYVDPKSIERIFTLERNKADLAAGLEQSLSGGRLAEWLASLPPSDAEYTALSAAYCLAGSACQGRPAAKREQSVPPDSPPPDTAPIPNASPQAAPPETPAAPVTPPQSTPSQSPAPQSPPPQSPTGQTPPAESAPNGAGAPANATSGGAPDETVSHDSASSENAPKRAISPAERARQLAANLERRRWLARTPAARRIDVNTAGCFLTYLKPGADPWAARGVLGKKGHETPSIQASFHRLVANPPWRVPMDIARREIFPKGGGYLRREHMRVIGGQVVQQPGPHSSLGVVKFDVEDPYAIYLHDTPSKSLFALPERHKSHGCVRVQDAVGFARLLADQAGKRDAFDKALASGKTREVDIGEAIPVRLLYHTAYADADGKVAILPDAYGWNEKLAAALGFHAAATNGSGEPDVDLGP